MDFRVIIKVAMQRRGVSQGRLEALTGVRQHRISDFLTGKRDVTSGTLGKLFKALGLKVTPWARAPRKEKI